MKYSISIVTFNKRFEEFFKPLIVSIKEQRPDVEILVEVNGNYKESFDQNYRKDLLRFASEFDNVFVELHPKFSSLAKLWNRGILNSSNDLVLTLNDDIQIKPGFFDWLEEALKNSNFFIINDIWSHFLISRNVLSKLNWFDERFLGVGWEDWDIARHKVKPISFRCKEVNSFHDIEKKPAQDNITGVGKYTKFNYSIYSKKWLEKDENLKEQIQYPYYNFEQLNKNNL